MQKKLYNLWAMCKKIQYFVFVLSLKTHIA